jgi:hypothetical protein
VYLDRSAQHQAHYPVPVKPVLEAIERWLADEAKRSGWRRGRRNQGIASPYTRLAVRAGMSKSSCERTISRFRKETTRMTLACAERFIDATYGDELWNSPELAPFRPVPTGDGMLSERDIRHWAWRQVKAMSRNDRRAVAMGLSRLLDADESRAARHAGPKRERDVFRPHPYAPLEKAFGATARGEREAA